MASKPIDVLVVGQTPPPYHGQAIMIDMLVRGSLPRVRIHHVRMAFSDSMDQVGRFRWFKLVHLVQVIFQIIWTRIFRRTKILYYPPSGPNRVPLIRDIIILLSTRWMFRRTVFHFQASGLSELLPKLPGWLRWFANRALSRPDAAIVLSPFTRNDAEAVQAKSIFTIPNAAKDHALPLPDRDRIGHAIRILYVGTVCESKGIIILLEACRILRSRGVDIYLDVVGSFQPAAFEENVRLLIRNSSIESLVTLHGQRIDDDKWQMFRNADVFCFPTHYESEGFPCVLVEAMSFALPVVTTHWRGIPSIVVDDTTGCLVETKNSVALSDRLQELIFDPLKRQRMGVAGRARYESLYTDLKHLDQMDCMFCDIA